METITPLDKRQIQFNLNKIASIKTILHENFYNREDVIQYLTQLISNRFEVFNINYDYKTKSIQIKIKKTTMKKLSSYECTSTYYYTILGPLFIELYRRYENDLRELLSRYQNIYNFNGAEINEYLLSPISVNCMYGITIILDNIIVVKL